MRISEKLELKLGQRELDFVDLIYKEDTQLFLDPFLFENKDHKFCREAFETIDSFFLEVKNAILKNDDNRISELFEHTGEFEYISLGYGKNSVFGSGAGKIKKKKICEYIMENKEKISNQVSLTSLSDFANIEGVSNDIISDIIGNLISKNLSKYTEVQINNLKEKKLLNSEKNYFLDQEIFTWNKEEKQWKEENIKMLNLGDDNENIEPRLLVPLQILRSNIVAYSGVLKNYLNKGKSMKKSDILQKMNLESEKYSLAKIKYKEKNNINGLFRENILKKIKKEEKIKEYNSMDFKEIFDFFNIIELLFVDYLYYPEFIRSENFNYIRYNNLKKQKDIFKNDYFLFFYLDKKDLDLFYEKINSLKGIKIVILDEEIDEEKYRKNNIITLDKKTIFDNLSNLKSKNKICLKTFRRYINIKKFK